MARAMRIAPRCAAVGRRALSTATQNEPLSELLMQSPGAAPLVLTRCGSGDARHETAAGQVEAATSASLHALRNALSFNVTSSTFNVTRKESSITAGEAMLGRLDHYLRSYDRFMEADREKLRVHVKLGCPDGYKVDLSVVKGHFPYVGEEQVNVELVRGGLTHPTGSFADGGAAAEDIVVVNAAVSVTYHGGSL